MESLATRPENSCSNTSLTSTDTALTASNTLNIGFASRLGAALDKRLISGFHPAFFASVMGTGISCNILYNFAFPAHWLQVAGIVMAVVALLLFMGLSVAFFMAMYRDPQLWTKIHRDPAVAPFMGCFVMGMVPLVNILHSLTGKSWIVGVWVLWWIEVVALVYTSFVTFFFATVSKNRHSNNVIDPSSLSLSYLLPVVTLTVAASSGGLIVPDLPNLNLKIVTNVVALLMWAIAVVLAFIVVTVNFWRLFVHKIPSTDKVFTMFLPIGFLGQGAYGILLFGRNCTTLILENAASVPSSLYTSFLHETASENSIDMSQLSMILASTLLIVSSMFAAILMAFGYFFTFLAVASALSKSHPFAKKRNRIHTYLPSSNWFKQRFSGFIKFNRAFWSMTFPLGTMALANGEFYNLFNGLRAFRYISAMYGAALFLIVLGCLFGVVYQTGWEIRRALFPSDDPKEMV